MNQEKTSLWNRENLKNPHGMPDKAQRVRQMFSSIAAHYDRLNHLLSLNQDRRWRKKAVQSAAAAPGQKLLDLCCGTGDLALAFAEMKPRLSQITGLDFSEPMLTLARQKQQAFLAQNPGDAHNQINFQWLCADALNLPFPPASFDRVSCAFGLRNLQNLPQGLNEIYRVLQPSGKAVILEFALPRHPLLAGLYSLYFRLVIPLAGSIISGDRSGAYHYLPQSVLRFLDRPQLEQSLIQAGFAAVHTELLSGGLVLLIVADKE